MTERAPSNVERLEAFCQQLLDAIDEFEHHIRRCTDALERAGGRSRQHERRLRDLRGNRAMCYRDLQQARMELRTLRRP